MRTPVFHWIPVLAVVLAVPSPAGASAHGPQWMGTVRLDAERTSDVFPGGETAEAASLLRLTLQPQVQFRVSSSLKVRPWADLQVERYREIPARDVTCWQFGVDFRRGGSRLRLFHGLTNDELYFLTPTGGAWTDQRTTGAELRLGVSPDVRLMAGIERESQEFDPLHVERDDHRWITRLGVERGDARRLRTALVWLYRDTESVTGLYTYRQNVLRADVEGTLPSHWRGAARLEGGLRNYDTGIQFANNFGRQDHRWRARLAVGHPLSAPLSAEAYHAWRQTESTRLGKDSVVREFGLSLVYDR